MIGKDGLIYCDVEGCERRAEHGGTVAYCNEHYFEKMVSGDLPFVCDLCGEHPEHPWYTYIGKDVAYGMSIGPGGSQTHVDVGDWLVCKPCHEAIQAEDDEALITRILAQWDPAPPRYLAEMAIGTFRDSWTGEWREGN